MRKMKVYRPGVLILVSMALTMTIGFLGCATPEKSAQTKTDSSKPTATVSPTPREAPAPLSAVSPQMHQAAPFYPTPAKMDLCAEPVPLHSQDVFERFDKEFTIIVYNHAQVYLWLKRMERYFPWIEDRLHRYGLPDDLKYVVIAESDLVPNVASNKGAAGPWQFMPSTGSSYGLERRGTFDSRYDFERSTEGALRLLEDLRKRHNSWAMAIAAYNCGDKRILEESRAQRVTDYYHMKLPQETERYVFRILAIKAVLGNPGQYGYTLPKGHGYPEHRLDRVSISLSSPLPIQTAAESAGITFREFKRLNPTFRSDSIPAGTFEIKLPEGKGAVFEQNHSSARTQMASLPASSASPVEEEPAPGGPVQRGPDALQPADGAPDAAKRDDPPGEMSGASRASDQEPSRESAAKLGDTPPKPRKVSAAAAPTNHRAEVTRQKPSATRNQMKSSASRKHHVKKGDTLSQIAKLHQVSVQELQQANGLRGGEVKIGQKLVIP